ncbi:MAG: ligase-associated DNA damage response exonuclease [Opitutales bacterium]
MASARKPQPDDPGPDALVVPTADGLYCRAGGFHIDPWRKVDRALITHAHSDHARQGCGTYLTAASGTGVLQERVGRDAAIEGLPFGEKTTLHEVTVSFHPAGHLLGSGQIRLAYRGEVWVISGDYKTAPDPSCEAFEPVPCDVFITESTFGLPIYRWPEPASVFADINRWWRRNREVGLTSVVYAYSLGKAQRVLCGLDPAIGPIGVHGAVNRFLPHYRAVGIRIPDTLHANRETAPDLKGRGLIVAPGSSAGTPWLRRFSPHSDAFASGWMAVRGARRWRGLDRGFVLSDHADWPGLIDTINATGAERIGVTHGSCQPMVRWLRENGRAAWEVPTRYTGETRDAAEEEPDEEAGDSEKSAS